MSDIDLLIRNASLEDSKTPVGIAFSAGRIAYVKSGIVCDALSFDADDKLATPGLTETHIHLGSPPF